MVSWIMGQRPCSKNRRPDDGMLHVGHWRDSVSDEKGQSELMGSIRCTRILFILVTTSQSHCLPLSLLLLSQPTGRSEDPHQYQYR